MQVLKIIYFFIDFQDEGMALYDEYLLSKLMLLNVQQNCREAKKAANKDVLNMLTAIEDIRSEVSIYNL